jgi:hypothetical protein
MKKAENLRGCAVARQHGQSVCRLQHQVRVCKCYHCLEALRQAVRAFPYQSLCWIAVQHYDKQARLHFYITTQHTMSSWHDMFLLTMMIKRMDNRETYIPQCAWCEGNTSESRWLACINAYQFTTDRNTCWLTVHSHTCFSAYRVPYNPIQWTDWTDSLPEVLHTTMYIYSKNFVQVLIGAQLHLLTLHVTQRNENIIEGNEVL